MSRWHRGQLSRLGLIVRLLLLAFVIHVFVLPQLGGAREAWDRLSSLSPATLGLAVLFEALALGAYAELIHRLLPLHPGPRPSRPVCLGVVLASTAVNHVVPGGAATTAAVSYRLYGRAGVPPRPLSFALATQAIGSAVVLNLIFWMALVVSIPVSGFHPIYATAAAVGAVLIVAAALGVLALVRGSDRLAAVVAWAGRRFRQIDPESVRGSLDRAAQQFVTLGRDRRRAALLVGLAAANWLFDAATLWLVMAAFGHRPGVVGVLVAYGLANVLAAIPVTPGGLGVVEAVLIPSLIGFGNPASAVAVGVVVYRLISFWLPIPIGLGAFVAVEHHLRSPHPAQTVKPVLADLAAHSAHSGPARGDEPPA